MTDLVTRDDISPDRFSNKHSFKVRSSSYRKSVLAKGRSYIFHSRKLHTKVLLFDTYDSFRRWHFLFVCSVQQHKWRRTKSLNGTWRNKAPKSGCQRPLLFPQDVLTASRHPHNSLSSYCCSLLAALPVSVLKQLGASFSQSEAPSQSTSVRHGPLLTFTLRILSFKDTVV